MGGLERGGDAATLAASAFLAYLAESQIGSIRQRLLDAVLWANRSVFDSLRGRGGTTLTALIIGKSKLSWCAHVGDSRLYVRQNKNEEFVQVSRDDTLGGVLSDGRSSDDNPSNGLLQYVGMGEDLQPHVSELSANGDSTFVLTTDGVHGIQQSIVREVFRAAKTVEELTKRLLTVAEAIGTRDNASVVTMHPAEFVAERSFEIGRSLTIWTTSERLDIWLPVAFNYDLSERRNPPRVPDEGKKIPHPSASKRKKSPKTKVKHQKSLDVESSEKPQLRIEFSDSDPKADD
jgi:serine/threonine protein phosphatase PrpC